MSEFGYPVGEGLQNQNAALRYDVVLKAADGTEWRLVVPATSTPLLSMSLVDADGFEIVRVPFSVHGTRLHTVCNLNEVTQVEW